MDFQHIHSYHIVCHTHTSFYCSSSVSVPPPSCIIHLHPICHEIPHLLDTQKGRLCLFFIWTEGDGARCLAAAECSGVTVLVTGHDEQPQMKDEAWRILGRAAPLDLLPQEHPHWSEPWKVSSESLLAGISSYFLISHLKPYWKYSC